MGLQLNLSPHKVTLSRLGKGCFKGLPDVGGRKVFGMLHAGGPAPASNAAIKGAVEAAISSGACIFGFEDGFKGAMNGNGVLLTRELVSGIERDGGVALGSSRFNPKEAERKQFIELLKHWGIQGLITIGGDDTNTTASRLAREGFPVVGVPKTIDNDLPGTEITHGFTTFVEYCSEQLRNLKRDAAAQDGPAIYLAEIMGRSSGSLTLASGRAAEATGIFIPEEFSLLGISQIINSPWYPAKDAIIKRIARMVEVNGNILNTPDFLTQVNQLTRLSRREPQEANSAIKLNAGKLANEIVNIIETRMKMIDGENGPKYGVFAVAEGISGKLPTRIAEKDNAGNAVKFEVMGLLTPVMIGVDAHHNPRIADVNVGAHLVSLVNKIANERGMKIKVVPKQIGYELRCADPVTFDINLGIAEGSLAARLLVQGITGVMVVAKANGDVSYVEYGKLPRDKNDHLVPRMVDLSGEQYLQAANMQRYKLGMALEGGSLDPAH